MGLLRVTVEEQADITASGATLRVLVEGETFVVGNAALERAREVREFVAALGAAGLTPDAVNVRGVRIANSSGLLGKNQKVQFNLDVKVTPAQLPEVLGTVAAGRNLQLQELAWSFDAFEATVPLAAQAMQRARRKADAIMGAAGHRVTGVHHASDSWDMPVVNVTLGGGGAADAHLLRSRLAGPVDVGVEYSATQSVTVHLTVDFAFE